MFERIRAGENSARAASRKGRKGAKKIGRPRGTPASSELPGDDQVFSAFASFATFA
jgi:hypothetical protein